MPRLYHLGENAELVLGYLERFPRCPAKSLARLIIKEHPDIYSDSDDPLEAIRGVIRYYRGSRGDRARRSVASERSSTQGRFVRAKSSRVSECRLPAEDVERFRYDAVRIDGAEKVLILSDTHFPYHDRKAIETAVDWGVRRKPDTILLNGDIVDFYQASVFVKDPSARNLADELKVAGKFLGYLRERFPKSRVLWRLANHERRWETYLWRRAPELVGVEAFELKEILPAKEYGVEVVNTRASLLVGKLKVLHGDEIGTGFYDPASPARYIYLKTKANVFCGHFHRTSQHTEAGMDGYVVSVWASGCLCYLHPAYKPINQWNHGFGYVEVDPKGAFRVWNLRIVDGKVWE